MMERQQKEQAEAGCVGDGVSVTFIKLLYVIQCRNGFTFNEAHIEQGIHLYSCLWKDLKNHPGMYI